VLYQDYLLDDHGAAGVPDPGTPWDAGSFTFSPPGGTFTYPSDPVYADNAADLVELRVKPLGTRPPSGDARDAEGRIEDGLHDRAGHLGCRARMAGRRRVKSPAQLFVTVHGSTAELSDGKSGATAAVDMERRQIDVRLPHAAWDPGRARSG